MDVINFTNFTFFVILLWLLRPIITALLSEQYVSLRNLFPSQKAEKGRIAEEKLQDLKVLVADLDSALASPDTGSDPSSAKQIAKKYDVSMW